jgi:hypothetical protein
MGTIALKCGEMPSFPRLNIVDREESPADIIGIMNGELKTMGFRVASEAH